MEAAHFVRSKTPEAANPPLSAQPPLRGGQGTVAFSKGSGVLTRSQNAGSFRGENSSVEASASPASSPFAAHQPLPPHASSSNKTGRRSQGQRGQFRGPKEKQTRRREAADWREEETFLKSFSQKGENGLTTAVSAAFPASCRVWKAELSDTTDSAFPFSATEDATAALLETEGSQNSSRRKRSQRIQSSKTNSRRGRNARGASSADSARNARLSQPSVSSASVPPSVSPPISSSSSVRKGPSSLELSQVDIASHAVNAPSPRSEKASEESRLLAALDLCSQVSNYCIKVHNAIDAALRHVEAKDGEESLGRGGGAAHFDLRGNVLNLLVKVLSVVEQLGVLNSPATREGEDSSRVGMEVRLFPDAPAAVMNESATQTPLQWVALLRHRFETPHFLEVQTMTDCPSAMREDVPIAFTFVPPMESLALYSLDCKRHARLAGGTSSASSKASVTVDMREQVLRQLALREKKETVEANTIVKESWPKEEEQVEEEKRTKLQSEASHEEPSACDEEEGTVGTSWNAQEFLSPLLQHLLLCARSSDSRLQLLRRLLLQKCEASAETAFVDGEIESGSPLDSFTPLAAPPPHVDRRWFRLAIFENSSVNCLSVKKGTLESEFPPLSVKASEAGDSSRGWQSPVCSSVSHFSPPPSSKWIVAAAVEALSRLTSCVKETRRSVEESFFGKNKVGDERTVNVLLKRLEYIRDSFEEVKTWESTSAAKDPKGQNNAEAASLEDAVCPCSPAVCTPPQALQTRQGVAHGRGRILYNSQNHAVSKGQFSSDSVDRNPPRKLPAKAALGSTDAAAEKIVPLTATGSLDTAATEHRLSSANATNGDAQNALYGIHFTASGRQTQRGGRGGVRGAGASHHHSSQNYKFHHHRRGGGFCGEECPSVSPEVFKSGRPSVRSSGRMKSGVEKLPTRNFPQKDAGDSL